MRGCFGIGAPGTYPCSCTWSLESFGDSSIPDHTNFHLCKVTGTSQGQVYVELYDTADPDQSYLPVAHRLDVAFDDSGSSCAAPNPDGTPWVNLYDTSVQPASATFYSVQDTGAPSNCGVTLVGNSSWTFDACDNEHRTMNVQFQGNLFQDGGPSTTLTYPLRGGFVSVTY